MSITPISSLESARRKFFMISSQNMCNKLGIKRFWAQEAENESNSHKFARIGEQEIFHESNVHHS